MSRPRARPAGSKRRTAREWLGELSTTIKAAGGLAGALAAIAGLVFLFFPGCRPSLEDGEGSATFSKPTLEKPVTYGQFLERVEVPAEGSTEEQLARPGVLVGVMVTIKGYKDKALPLRWYILDVSTHDIVEQQSKRFLLETNRDEAPAVWPLWVPLPKGPGPFKLVLQIYPPSATGKPGIVPLAETETDPFPGGDA